MSHETLADAIFTSLTITGFMAFVYYCVFPRPLKPGERDDFDGHD